MASFRFSSVFSLSHFHFLFAFDCIKLQSVHIYIACTVGRDGEREREGEGGEKDVACVRAVFYIISQIYEKVE